MFFAEAIEFSKKFPTRHPKIFKGFVDWGVWDAEIGEYVVLTDVTLINELSSSQIRDYVRKHKLRILQVKSHLMVCALR
jgi:hypothetical protein